MDRLTKLLANDRAAISAWSGIPDPFYLGMLARTGFDVITLDMQHNMHSEFSVLNGLATLTPLKKPVIVRVPVGRYDMASKALDAGAHGIIAPMINTVEDAKKLVSFTKYVPVGDRSHGVTQAVSMLDVDRIYYLTQANTALMTIAMIETREAVDNMTDIMDVDGIDGVFVGPADLSVSIRNDAVPDPYGKDTVGIVEQIGKEATKRGKIAGAFAGSVAHAELVHGFGFRLISLGMDHMYIGKGADTMIESLSFR